MADIPLLFETGAKGSSRPSWSSRARASMQLTRLMERNKLSKEDAERRLGAQLPIDQKVKKATHVIRTDGTFEETDAQVAELIKKLSAK